MVDGSGAASFSSWPGQLKITFSVTSMLILLPNKPDCNSTSGFPLNSLSEYLSYLAFHGRAPLPLDPSLTLDQLRTQRIPWLYHDFKGLLLVSGLKVTFAQPL